MDLHPRSTQATTTSHAPTLNTADTRRRGSWFVLARGAWITLLVLTLAIFFGSLPTYLTQLQTPCTVTTWIECVYQQLTAGQVETLKEFGFSLGDYAAFTVALTLAAMLVCLAVSTLIIWHRSDDRMALLVALSLVTLGPIDRTSAASLLPGPWQVPNECLVFLNGLQLLVFFLFPSGQFVPRWTRWICVAFFVWEVPFFLFPKAKAVLFIGNLGWLVILGQLVTIALVQLYRYRRVSSPLQRQQTKWVVFGLAVPVTVLVIGTVLTFLPAFASRGSLYPLAYNEMGILIVLCPALAFGFAILRSHLWDIDLIIGRTLVYGTLTVSVIGLYVLVVVGLGTLIQSQGNLLLSLLATGLIAVLFQPLRLRLQRAVNRLLFGERDEPYTVISRLGQRLEATLAPEAVLPTIVETVTGALKLPYAAISLKQDGEDEIAASSGRAADELTRLPLVYQGEHLGDLLLSPRARSEPFSSADRALLTDLARQAGIAVHAVRLTTDLQRLTKELQHSRTELVTAREEERRRLRRDLHDGLGSVLASLNWRAGALRSVLVRDPIAADALVVEQQHTIRAAIGDIRRLVYDLRPPALDELGLIGAIREQAARQSAPTECDSVHGLRVDVAASDLPQLSAAVEVAAYRIVQEALANVVRHAHAHRCRICLSCEQDMLHVEVTDDGIGLPERYRAGVGLLSIRERTEELGGTCEIAQMPEGGMCVRAWLPRLLHEQQL